MKKKSNEEDNEKKTIKKEKKKKSTKVVEKEKIDDVTDNEDSGFTLFEVIFVVCISILFGIVVGCILTYQRNGNMEEDSQELRDFIVTYNNLTDDYYDKVSSKELIEAAISGMVDSLQDPYSTYMNGDVADDFNEVVDGSYVGIGATVSLVDGQFKVVEVTKDSGASKAGMKKDDIIIKVGKNKVDGMTLDKLASLIKGKEGTKVSITVKRNNKEKVLNVERKVVELESATSKVIENKDKKIGYIELSSIASNTYKQFNNQLVSLEKQKIDSLIIDVRSNPGGHLTQTKKILDLFFDKKTVLYQIEVKGKKEKVLAEDKDKREYPVIILTNADSASAAEIIASCFKENYSKAKIVGETTYGKGTVQKAIELSSGASLKYTSEKWLTSKGKWINEKGVKPDYEVETTKEYLLDPVDEKDTQLQKALELLTKKEN